MSTIPAKEIVDVIPGVLAAGGTGLDMVGLILTESTRPPIGTVQSFASVTSVEEYFGGASREAELATIYFNGFEGRTKIPGALLFAQYPSAAVAAYVRGGAVSGLTLAELQAISGGLTITFEGHAVTDASIDLSGATSFSSAAGIIETQINGAIATTGSFTASISGTTMTVTAIGSGAIALGDTIGGGTVDAGTIVLEQLTGTTGGTGTYRVSVSQTEGSGSLTAEPTAVVVSYDSTSGAFVITSGNTGAISTVAFPSGTLATAIKLTAATGAVLSQGAAAATPSAFMTALIAVNQAWATFMTAFDPDVSGNTNKRAFAAWNTGQNDRFGYVCWDTDPTAASLNPASSSLGRLLAADGDSGTCLLWTADADLAAFVCGATASIDQEAANGRITFAFRRQEGLVGEVTTALAAENLIANGYNFYGAYGAAASQYVWFQDGSVTGDFRWFDSYVNQIWLNARLQIALLDLLEVAKSIPFNASGNSRIETSISDVVAQALNFGAFAPGAITAAQQTQVNTQAGKSIAASLQAQGWYFQVNAASSAVRAARGPIPCSLWYLDRGSVQRINLNSVAVQ